MAVIYCSLNKVSHLGVRKVQISVWRSSAEVLQDLSAGGRELQRGEMRPALLLTGRSHHNVPVDAETPVSREGRFFVFASITVQHAVSRAVFKQPVQTQTPLQIFDRFRPLLRCVMVQSQSVRSGEGHELLFGEISETVVFILCRCHKNEAQAKQREQRVSLCAKSNHDGIICDILICVFCAPPATFILSAWWSAEVLRCLWEFRDWAHQRLLSRVSQCRSTAVS